MMQPRPHHFLLALVTVWMCFGTVVAQTAPDTWWVQFTDKENTPYTLGLPLEFLSQRAVDRRSIQGIAVDQLDLPVDPVYIQTVLALGEVDLVHRSRWFNAITVRVFNPDVLDAILALPFVSNVRATRSFAANIPDPHKFGVPAEGSLRGGGGEDYGASFIQVAMMNGHLLHALDARGEGLLIGVLDSGFEGADVLDAFDALRARDGIVFTKDLALQGGDVYEEHWHGRSVLSCMAAIVPGQLVGTATGADYALVRTEAVAFELVVEEDNWVSGAELLDSLGADILNTSLGYTRFDWAEQDHSYEDLDGSTTRISIAAGIAATRGMIPVVSAGNQGSSEWFHISAPADAMNILAVGAVGYDGLPAGFSSRGPSADGRVKPDVTAMGLGTIGLGVDGSEVTAINGTSFSAPLVAGLVACLWQLHPTRTANDVMDAVRRTASSALDPDAEMGHGIPDFFAAHEYLELTTGGASGARQNFSVYPIPFVDHLVLELGSDIAGPVEVELIDGAGRLVFTKKAVASDGGPVVIAGSGIARLGEGLYALRIRSAMGEQVRTVLKAW